MFRHIFFTIDCTFIQSPDGTIYRARRYMPNTTKTLLKEHQDISFIKKFATKLYNDNEKYKAEYSKTIIFERPSEVGNLGIISF